VKLNPLKKCARTQTSAGRGDGPQGEPKGIACGEKGRDAIIGAPMKEGGDLNSAAVRRGAQIRKSRRKVKKEKGGTFFNLAGAARGAKIGEWVRSLEKDRWQKFGKNA